MAYAVVGSPHYGSGGATASTVTLSAAFTPTAGSLLVAICPYYYYSTPATLTISDTVGGEDAWTAMGTLPYVGDLTRFGCWYRIATGGSSCNVQVAFGGTYSSYPSLAVYEFSGIDTGAPYLTHGYTDRLNPGTGAGAIDSPLTGTLSAQPALIVGAFIEKNYNGTVTVASTLSDGTTTQNDFGDYIGLHARVTATTSVSTQWTDSNGGAQNYSTFVAAFQEASGSVYTPRSMLLGVG